MTTAKVPIGEPGFSVEANGTVFRCQVDGPECAPWIIFGNALATNPSLWDEQVDFFKETFRVLRYDQRGHGETDVSLFPCTFDLLADDVVALLDVLEIERAIFVGVSMGAVTALRLAVRFPGRFECVVVSDGRWVAPPEAVEIWEERIGIAEARGMEELVESSVRRWFCPEFVAANPPQVDKARNMIRGTKPAGYAWSARALQRYDFRNDCSTIRIPVLLIVGVTDGVLPQTMREMHYSIPGSAFVEIDQSCHFPNVESPHLFNKAIADFLMTSAAVGRPEAKLS